MWSLGNTSTLKVEREDQGPRQDLEWEQVERRGKIGEPAETQDWLNFSGVDGAGGGRGRNHTI